MFFSVVVFCCGLITKLLSLQRNTKKRKRYVEISESQSRLNFQKSFWRASQPCQKPLECPFAVARRYDNRKG